MLWREKKANYGLEEHFGIQVQKIFELVIYVFKMSTFDQPPNKKKQN